MSHFEPSPSQISMHSIQPPQTSTIGNNPNANPSSNPNQSNQSNQSNQQYPTSSYNSSNPNSSPNPSASSQSSASSSHPQVSSQMNLISTPPQSHPHPHSQAPHSHHHPQPHFQLSQQPSQQQSQTQHHHQPSQTNPQQQHSTTPNQQQQQHQQQHSNMSSPVPSGYSSSGSNIPHPTPSPHHPQAAPTHHVPSPSPSPHPPHPFYPAPHLQQHHDSAHTTHHDTTFILTPGSTTSNSSYLVISSEEKTISTILRLTQFDDIIPLILSFLSVVELMFVQSISHRYYRFSSEARISHVSRIYLGQFWSRIGMLDISHFQRLIGTFQKATELNLAYCHHVTGEILITLTQSVPKYQELTSLHLYYCHLLQDHDIQKILPIVPALTCINLGRCHNLTMNTIRFLSDLPNLRRLTFAYNGFIDEEVTMLLDDPSKFPALDYLNVLHCPKLKMEMMEEVRIQRPGLKILGPIEVFAADKNGKRIKQDNIE